MNVHPGQTLEQTRSLQRQRLTGRGPIQERIERAFQAIDRQAIIGDVFVQNQDQPLTFGWGAFRVAGNIAETRE